MVTKRKSSKSSSAKRKSTSADSKRKSPSESTSKSRLGHVALDWITNTTASKAILPEAERRRIKTAEVSKETKIGLVKKYTDEKGLKKENDIKEMPPGISADSFTILKGKKATPVEKEGAEKTEMLEKKESTAAQESLPVSTEPVKIAQEKELISAEEVKKNLHGKNGNLTEDKKIPVQDEIHEKDLPEDSSAIVNKNSEAASQEQTRSREVKISSEKKKTGAPAAAAKEKIPSPAKRKWMEISGMSESLKKESQKVSGAIVKTLKSDKIKLKKWVSFSPDVSGQLVKAISAVDRKVTRCMKKVVFLGDSGISGKSVLKNIAATDARITKSAKKLINSLLD